MAYFFIQSGINFRWKQWGLHLISFYSCTKFFMWKQYKTYHLSSMLYYIPTSQRKYMWKYPSCTCDLIWIPLFSFPLLMMHQYHCSKIPHCNNLCIHEYSLEESMLDWQLEFLFRYCLRTKINFLEGLEDNLQNVKCWIWSYSII